MAKRFILQNLMKLAKDVGANQNKFMGTRTNVTFLGKGPTKNPLFQSPLAGIDEASMKQLGPGMIPAVEDAMAYATAGKLNSIQMEILGKNLEGIRRAMYPPMATVTDIAPGIEGLRRFPKETHKFMGRPLKDKDFVEIDELVKRGKLPPAVDLPQKTYAARASMYRLLDMQAGHGGLTLREIMSPRDLKFLLEGGGNPIAMFTKYFGNAAARQLPTEATPKVIEEFATRVIRTKDSMGRGINDPFFRPEDFAHGGLARILEV